MRFFLGTNGPNGFFSYFDNLIDYGTAKDVTIIKGGPGCGKSTYMNIVNDALKCGDAEYIYCSSDPKSLDGIVYPKAGVAMVDGTAPHVWRTYTHHYIQITTVIENKIWTSIAAQASIVQLIFKDGITPSFFIVPEKG